ncbi:bifunctional 4-hydroxy-2-oxoglutarate aldolase/2-dehydro-3-deoxy-phosphogluconate aldolase [Guptibacillus hwajinpoensis]|uniref:2-dehydro-3-deoxyphosphogluconate aldolase n=1 Tax=Guptibacillus hwajinpoensis TaxID=208199 RepID=A0A0J6CVQ9_9BACL|nr:bifunctional 4-hydroxy-2-oxoglutarate aldolase/2-dehydro-3-deoxy-phosphogluconate aldolase [Alkalihalobacillus macyae]KMM37248.1 hypothetical protein AB986_15395 [Alkalihalobacillus macyae]
MRKEDIKSLISEKKMIAILRNVSEDKIIPTVEALIEGGVSLLEVTFDHNHSNYITNTSDKIRGIKEAFGEDVQVGAGTVLTPEEVVEAVKAGAEFIISPNVDEKVIEKTIELGKISIPGALTPTEAVIADRHGADYIKLFPAGELGHDFIKAFMGPLNHLAFLAVGGISPTNIQRYLNTGITGVGVGGSLVLAHAIEKNDYRKITEVAKLFNSNIYQFGGNTYEKSN